MRLNQKKLVLLSFCFFLFLFVVSRSKVFSSIKFKFVEVTSLPARILSFPIQEIKKILYYHRTFEEYKRLRKKVDTLEARFVGMDEVIRENTRLAGLLEFKRKLIYSSVAANVIGRNPSYWNSSMTIDKGENEGIRIGMPVINALGVVGKVVEVSSKLSKVMLVTDPQFSVAALIQRPRESGLVSGTLRGVCRLKYLNPEARIRIGDKVITSKLSLSFPEGLLIGSVIEVSESADKPSVECIVEPAVSVSQIEEVLVILK